MKSFIKLIIELVVIFFLVNIAQDIIYFTIDKIQEPYVVQIEEMEQQLEELNELLENEMV